MNYAYNDDILINLVGTKDWINARYEFATSEKRHTVSYVLNNSYLKFRRYKNLHNIRIKPYEPPKIEDCM